jgi:hypothetical protein
MVRITVCVSDEVLDSVDELCESCSDCGKAGVVVDIGSQAEQG